MITALQQAGKSSLTNKTIRAHMGLYGRTKYAKQFWEFKFDRNQTFFGWVFIWGGDGVGVGVGVQRGGVEVGEWQQGAVSQQKVEWVDA